MPKVKELLEAASAIPGSTPIIVYAVQEGSTFHLASPSCPYARQTDEGFFIYSLKDIVEDLCPRCSNAKFIGCMTPDLHGLVSVRWALKMLKVFNEHLGFLTEPLKDKRDAYIRLCVAPWLDAYKANINKILLARLGTSSSLKTKLVSDLYPYHIPYLIGCHEAMQSSLDAVCDDVVRRSRGLPEDSLRDELESVRDLRPWWVKVLRKPKRYPLDEERMIAARVSRSENVKVDSLMRLYGSSVWAENIPAFVFLEIVNHCKSWTSQTTNDPEVLETASILFRDGGLYTTVESAIKAAEKLK